MDEQKQNGPSIERTDVISGPKVEWIYGNYPISIVAESES
jgi:hypothetical protein